MPEGEGYRPPSTEELLKAIVRQREHAHRETHMRLLGELGDVAVNETEKPDVSTD